MTSSFGTMRGTPPTTQATASEPDRTAIAQTHAAASPAVRRILDANLDRAREGMRIVEEWCRFGLNDADLTETCKIIRQELAGWHAPELRAARDTPNDPGTDLSHPGEETRKDIEAVLQANLCRVEEALRVLEEYAKLYDPKMAQECKAMRYEVYGLDRQFSAYHRRHRLDTAQLYLVTSPSDRLFQVVEAALQGGLTLLQYRDKDADDATRIANGRQLKQLCQRYGALFIINDRADLALAVDADGVHLGQQDVPIAFARQLLGSQRIIGRSTTNPDEMRRAIEEGADYIGVGPVYETPTKPKAAAGLEYVRYAAEHSPIPWFAIGGLDMTNMRDVFEAGGRRIAVVRAIMAAEQPTLVTQYFLSQLGWFDRMRDINPSA